MCHWARHVQRQKNQPGRMARICYPMTSFWWLFAGAGPLELRPAEPEIVIQHGRVTGSGGGPRLDSV